MIFDENTGIDQISFRELMILCEDLYFNDLSKSRPRKVKISWSIGLQEQMFLGGNYPKDY